MFTEIKFVRAKSEILCHCSYKNNDIDEFIGMCHEAPITLTLVRPRNIWTKNAKMKAAKLVRHSFFKILKQCPLLKYHANGKYLVDI